MTDTTAKTTKKPAADEKPAAVNDDQDATVGTAPAAPSKAKQEPAEPKAT